MSYLMKKTKNELIQIIQQVKDGTVKSRQKLIEDHKAEIEEKNNIISNLEKNAGKKKNEEVTVEMLRLELQTIKTRCNAKEDAYMSVISMLAERE